MSKYLVLLLAVSVSIVASACGGASEASKSPEAPAADAPAPEAAPAAAPEAAPAATPSADPAAAPPK